MPQFKPGQSGNIEGRQPINIDPVELEKLAMVYSTQADMAAYFGCTQRTIENRVADKDTRYAMADGAELTFSEIIERGKSKGRVSLRQAQFKLALDGNATMQIWMGKQLLGQTDEQTIKHAGKIDSGGTTAETIAEKLRRVTARASQDAVPTLPVEDRVT